MWVDTHVDHERGAGHKIQFGSILNRERRFMLVAKDIRTVCDIGGVLILEIIKEQARSLFSRPMTWTSG